MSQFVIHQHHHYGWTMNTHEVAFFEEAAMADLLKYHPWLPEYGHRVIFFKTKYEVQYAGAPYPSCYYSIPYMFRTDAHWFSDRMHQGQPDDCGKCGGTGVNQYNPFRQCWACGDKDKDGKSSGKHLVAA